LFHRNILYSIDCKNYVLLLNVKKRSMEKRRGCTVIAFIGKKAAFALQTGVELIVSGERGQ
jgi:hypothetical protein